MDFKKMSIADLRQYAKDKGIRGVSALKKPELVDLLEKVEMMTVKNNAVASEPKEQPKTEEKVENIAEEKQEVAQSQSANSANNLKVYDGQEYDPSLDSGQRAYGILEVMEGYGFIRSDNYLPGDKIRLKEGNKKISRIFIDKKVPSHIRNIYPVVLNKDGIVIFVPKFYKDLERKSLQSGLFMVQLIYWLIRIIKKSIIWQ